MTRILALMGSGENSPIMVTPHQKIIKSTGTDLNPINLNTPYGFQENIDELSQKIEKYFEVNVGTKIKTSDNLIEDLKLAKWVFAGPGSPTYALRTWKATGADQLLNEVINRGTVVLASAAAMSIGAKVMPVYEMYKVGEDPFWLDGINLLESATGIRASVIAHYNNAQGGTHDTRFCFAGEKRMKILESLLDADVAILGIDEHTGITFDLEAKTAEIYGKGVITYKKNGETRTLAAKEIVPISDFN